MWVGKQNEAAGGYRSIRPEGFPVERQLRAEWRGVVRGGGGGGGGGGGRKDWRKEWKSGRSGSNNLITSGGEN